jgi:ADP-ribosylglycohydrolase/fructose-1,6-bisphosphatase/inositol monophosphatase family enzyme
MTRSYAAELVLAKAAAREAGAMLRDVFHGRRGGRDDHDEDVERHLREILRRATPYAYLGEELGEAEGADPTHVWVVDPHDGTAPALSGHRGAAVSIALVRGGVPVLGVVYAYAAPDGAGTLFAWAEGQDRLSCNDLPVAASLAGAALAPGAIVFVSQAADARALENARCAAPARYRATPSIAYRLALAAAGQGIAGVSLAGARSWDYAAGHALLRAAGGVLLDQDGREVTYDARGHGRTARCFGGAPAAARELAARSWDAVMARGEARAPRPYALLAPARDRLAQDDAALRRAQGAMLGQLAGDALGSLVEFRSAERILALYPGGVRDLHDGGEWDTLAGQPTDDSEMALLLARSIVAQGGYDAAAALDAYVHWHDSDPFDMGGTTRAALRAASRAPLRAERIACATASAKLDSQANGSLMRASPLGILGAGSPDEAAAWAREDSALTHPHAVCRESCAAFVAAIAGAIRGADREETYRLACAEAARGEERAVIDALARARLAPPESFTRHEGWVLVALQNAFYQLLHAPSLEEGVIATVMSGGDTDTNGAIAGALLGAVHGRDAVPERWSSLVLTCRPLAEMGALQPRPEEFWPVDALVLAESLLAIGSR